METLKSRIPEHLVQTVKSSSSVDDLLSSSSSLLRFLVGLPQFHQVKSSKTLTLLSASFSKVHWLVLKAVSELADPDLGCCGKSQESSLDLKRSGNLCFRSRSFDDALRFYSKALRVARDNTLLASLFLNRANALHVSYLSFSLRLVPFHSITQFILFFSCRIWGFLKRACGTAIVLFVLILVTPRFQLASFPFQKLPAFCTSHSYLFQAWFRRGKLNTLLGNYKDSFRDITVSMSLESSSAGKQQLQNELLAIPDFQNKQTSENTLCYAAAGEVFRYYLHDSF